MFKKLTNFCVAMVQRFLPDPFLFAVILTIIVFVGGIFATGQSPLVMTEHWVAGFWKLLAFSMQMSLILVTGHAMANAPIFSGPKWPSASTAVAPVLISAKADSDPSSVFFIGRSSLSD